MTLLMVTLLWTLVADDPWHWLVPSRIAVQIEDQVYLVSERRLERLAGTQPDWLKGAEQQAFERLEQVLDHEIDQLFSQAHDRVPSFADWYYSLPGTGVRLWSAIPWSNHDVTNRLFPEAEWAAQVDRLDETAAQLFSDEISGMQGRWLNWLSNELAPYRRDQPLREQQKTIDVLANLQSELAQQVDDTGLVLVMTTGPAATTLALRQVNARTAAARASARLASRSTALGGSSACGASGPAAPGCAALVFTGITLGTEWVILKGDEALNRPKLEEALHSSIEALQVELKAEYTHNIRAALEDRAHKLKDGMQKSIRPIDSLRAAPQRGQSD